MKKRIIFVDIDDTLISCESNYLRSRRSKLHLTKVAMSAKYLSYSGCRDYYAINLEHMKIIFTALLAEGIQIAFITNGLYQKGDFVPFFEQVYALATGALQNCIFVNTGTDYTNPVLRGDSIHAFLKKHSEKFDQVILLDDLPENLHNAKYYGYKTIHATGFLPYRQYSAYGSFAEIDPDNRYLQEIVNVCELPIVLAPIPVTMFQALSVKLPTIVEVEKSIISDNSVALVEDGEKNVASTLKISMFVVSQPTAQNPTTLEPLNAEKLERPARKSAAQKKRERKARKKAADQDAAVIAEADAMAKTQVWLAETTLPPMPEPEVVAEVVTGVDTSDDEIEVNIKPLNIKQRRKLKRAAKLAMAAVKLPQFEGLEKEKEEQSTEKQLTETESIENLSLIQPTTPAIQTQHYTPYFMAKITFSSLAVVGVAALVLHKIKGPTP